MKSLRRQLTETFLLIAAVIVATASAGIWFTVRYAVWAPLDAALREELEAVEQAMSTTPAELAATVAAIAAEIEPGPDKFVRVTTSDGHTISAGEQTAARQESSPGTNSWISGDHPFRSIRKGDSPGTSVEIGVRVDRQVAILQRCAAAILITGAIVLLALGFLASAVTHRATRELNDLADQLHTIEIGELGQRLGPRRTREVDRLVAALNRLLQRLETAVEQLKRFSADAAHELRTPIAGLRAHLELALVNSSATQAPDARLLDALERTERLSRIAEDLLTLSTIETAASAVSTDVALDGLVLDVAESLRPLAEQQGRAFSVNVEQNVGIRGTPALLRRLIVNLVDNAFRHTPPSAAVSLVLATRDDIAEVRVRDEGPGIKADEMPRVFMRFHRAGPGAGSGLGLALCREIVVRHGGEIDLKSEVDEGTTVTVCLPLNVSAHTASPLRVPSASGRRTRL